jgi:hypothetical protein
VGGKGKDYFINNQRVSLPVKKKDDDYLKSRFESFSKGAAEAEASLSISPLTFGFATSSSPLLKKKKKKSNVFSENVRLSFFLSGTPLSSSVSKM